MRASQFINENIDSDAVNELDTYIMNSEELYRRRFMPIISNIKRKMKKNVYDHEKAQKLWMYLVDDAAKEYVKEFGSTQDDVSNMFPKETRPYIDEFFSYEGYPQNAEKVNGRWAMLGFVAAVGAYVTTGQIIPGIF